MPRMCDYPTFIWLIDWLIDWIKCFVYLYVYSIYTIIEYIYIDKY